jgi:molybdopterin-guanine dinucleotide biosynthesis protein B
LLKLVGVIGGKHSGKTTIIEHLVTELKSRGYTVGVIKEMVRINTLDTPAKETGRYRSAGAETVVAVPRDETVFFISRRLKISEILSRLEGLDYVFLEGFESEAFPKIIAAKTVDEAQQYFDSSAIAISGLISDSKSEILKASSMKIPLLSSFKDIKKLVELVENVQNFSI